MSGALRRVTLPQRGDVVWMQHNPQAGAEMRDMHPMLVICEQAFIERTGIVIGFPMTHASFNADNPFAVRIQGPKAEVGYVLCHQPKSFDFKLRYGGKHPFRTVTPQILRDSLERLDLICGIRATLNG